MQQRRPGADRARRTARVPARSAVAPSAQASGPAPELRAVIDAMPEAVLVCDPGDRVRIVNPAADRLFAGRPVQDAGDLLSRFDPLPGAPEPDGSLTLQPRTIPNRWFELRTFPVARGAVPPSLGTPVPPAVASERTAAESGGRIIVLRDVTATRQERAERRAFLSILSHELRTPITTIYAGSRVLARGDPARATVTREIAKDISDEAARLYDVVEDLLVLTRAEQNLLDLSDEPILLQRVIEGAIRVARSRTPDVPIETSGATDPPAVSGDAVYVDQVVRNLVTAASRFGSPGAPVVISLETGDGEVSLEVIDRGPNLSPTEIETSFALTDDGGLRGTGLGIALFVCRRLVEAMHGRVWVRVPDGGGAAFGFALPRYESD
jgi:signal transduction histidine kinase